VLDDDRPTKRLCVCGCGMEAAPGSKYALEKHRKTVWRQKQRDAQIAAGLPEHLNLATLADLSKGTGQRLRDAQKSARKRSRRSPDLRVSYRRAVDAVATAIAVDQQALERLYFGAATSNPSESQIAAGTFRDRAEEILRPLLTPKQIQALEQGPVREWPVSE
jgi:hypothetical protein